MSVSMPVRLPPRSAVANPYLDRASLPARMRMRRFRIVNELIAEVLARQERCTILDIGGTEYYWRLNGDFLQAHRNRLKIVTVNLGDAADAQTQDPLFVHTVGDATSAEPYTRHAFDLIHSNSVIEHVGAWRQIRAMAEQIRGAGRPYYLQTPNFWFPLEPHFRTLGFQWMPPSWRAQLLLKKQRGFRAASHWDEAMESVESVNLLTIRQMRKLFPDAELKYERVGPLIKSIMAVRN